MHAQFGGLRDFVCRRCGLYGMVDVLGMEFDYDQSSGILFDILDDSDGRRRGDQIVCDCGCEQFDMQVQEGK
ncbi:MAG: hypothetical protein GXY42_05270 [Desulfovibrionales bacterium]|nr:hypothetical protein [Desulfovibrionales bacterium]